MESRILLFSWGPILLVAVNGVRNQSLHFPTAISEAGRVRDRAVDSLESGVTVILRCSPKDYSSVAGSIKISSSNELSIREEADRDRWAKAEAERRGDTMALRPQIILFGDSITQKSFQTDGWGAHVANEYARKVDVVLRGYSGYNTRWATYLLDKIFPIPSSNPPLLVTIFFGANDAALPDRGSRKQHVPVAEYKENLHRIISHLKKQSSSTHIVLITPPPVDIKGRQAYAKSQYGSKAETLAERTNEATGLYAEACEQVAREAGVNILKVWSIFQQTTNWEEKFLCDGLHLTPEGNVKVFEELQKLLGGLGLQWDTLPWDFPEHVAIDADNPAKTFID